MLKLSTHTYRHQKCRPPQP